MFDAFLPSVANADIRYIQGSGNSAANGRNPYFVLPPCSDDDGEVQ